jgi:ATP-dependent Clp protease ATP-binding subunit ClpA
MNGYNFTERTRRVLAMAREDAARLQHEYVGTEHLLLGLIRAREGVASAVLHGLGIDVEEVRQNIEKTVNKGGHPPTHPDLPYTSKAKNVLMLSMAAAREMSHSYVGTEHLLIALLRETKGIAAQVLMDAGLNADDAAAEVVRILSGDVPPTPRAPSLDASARGGVSVAPGPSRAGQAVRLNRLLSHCTLRLRSVIQAAIDSASAHSHAEAQTEHLLAALLGDDDGMGVEILDRLGADRTILKRKADDAVDRLPPSGGTEGPAVLSAVALDTFRRARNEIGEGELGTDHLRRSRDHGRGRRGADPRRGRNHAVIGSRRPGSAHRLRSEAGSAGTGARATKLVSCR